jgi:hypothetical protein
MCAMCGAMTRLSACPSAGATSGHLTKPAARRALRPAMLTALKCRCASRPQITAARDGFVRRRNVVEIHNFFSSFRGFQRQPATVGVFFGAHLCHAKNCLMTISFRQWIIWHLAASPFLLDAIDACRTPFAAPRLTQAGFEKYIYASGAGRHAARVTLRSRQQNGTPR